MDGANVRPAEHPHLLRRVDRDRVVRDKQGNFAPMLLGKEMNEAADVPKQ